MVYFIGLPNGKDGKLELNSNEEKKLYNAKTPKEFIDLSVKLSNKISWGRKGVICKQWLKDHPEFNNKDIQHARNRHPYWKGKKQEGNRDRSVKRNKEHNYSNSDYKEWRKDEIKEFIKMNKKESGKYKFTDIELAKYFKRSVGSVQYMKRKYNKACRILEAKDEKFTLINLFDLIIKDERILRKMLSDCLG